MKIFNLQVAGYVVAAFSIAMMAIYFNQSLLVYAADKFTLGTERFQFQDIDKLISMSARTLQYFTGGVAILYLILNGMKIITSGDNFRGMEEAKAGLFKVLLGCSLVFLAATIVDIVISSVNK
jgi:hypothetical protein